MKLNQKLITRQCLRQGRARLSPHRALDRKRAPQVRELYCLNKPIGPPSLFIPTSSNKILPNLLTSLKPLQFLLWVIYLISFNHTSKITMLSISVSFQLKENHWNCCSLLPFQLGNINVLKMVGASDKCTFGIRMPMNINMLNAMISREVKHFRNYKTYRPNFGGTL